MSERTRNELKEMFAGKRGADRSGLVRQAARLIVEEALEAEAGAELGRGYYEHGAGERGYRNGYRTGKVKTAEGVIEFAVPQVSDTAEPFRSQMRQVIRGRTEELERSRWRCMRADCRCATSRRRLPMRREAAR